LQCLTDALVSAALHPVVFFAQQGFGQSFGQALGVFASAIRHLSILFAPQDLAVFIGQPFSPFIGQFFIKFGSAAHFFTISALHTFSAFARQVFLEQQALGQSFGQAFFADLHSFFASALQAAALTSAGVSVFAGSANELLSASLCACLSQP
jgi:hypothetical protein